MGTAAEIKENKLGTAPIPSLIIKLSVPLMVSMFVLSLYNIVDSIFVAQINENALTAISLCFPIQSMMIAFGVGTAVGMSALMSRYLGAKELDKVNATAQNGIFLSFVTYAIFVIIGLFAKPFIEMQTSDPEIIEYGVNVSQNRMLAIGHGVPASYNREVAAEYRQDHIYIYHTEHRRYYQYHHGSDPYLWMVWRT